MRFPVALARFLVVLAVFWLGPHAAFASVGFQRIEIVDLTAGPIEVGIWYPAAAPAAASRLELFEQHVAPDATVLGDSLPLIVISHGHRGSFAGHHDTAIALAEAGFVAAALTHPRDNWRDASGATALWERPRHLKALIDYMLERWPDHARLDGRVGAFGFSVGGFTVLVTAGGVPDLRLIADHCRRHPQFEDCQIASGSLVAADDASITWVADHRIASVVTVAPALGYTFTPEGLESVRQPTQIWRAEYDRVLPHPYYAEPIRRALRRAPEMRVARNAGHYDFLSPCSVSLAAEVPAICASGDNFDRARFHRHFNREVVDFFQETLRPQGYRRAAGALWNGPGPRLARSFVDTDVMRQYWVDPVGDDPGHVNVSDWKPGSQWEHRRLDDARTVDMVGKVIETTPSRRLVFTWARPKDAKDDSKHSRVTFDVESYGGGLVRLTVTHKDLARDPQMLAGVSGGWPKILSNLKTLLESGRALPRAPSAA